MFNGWLVSIILKAWQIPTLKNAIDVNWMLWNAGFKITKMSLISIGRNDMFHK